MTRLDSMIVEVSVEQALPEVLETQASQEELLKKLLINQQRTNELPQVNVSNKEQMKHSEGLINSQKIYII